MNFNYYLGLGSNIKPRLIHLKNAITELETFGEIIKKSGVYESDAWGNENQFKFLNAVIQFQSNLEPFDLLKTIKRIEKKVGRKKSKINWGPREIDIDILFTDGIQIHENELQIPHKYFPERKFVLIPMAELNSRYEVENYNIEYYLNKCEDNLTIKNLNITW